MYKYAFVKMRYILRSRVICCAFDRKVKGKKDDVFSFPII